MHQTINFSVPLTVVSSGGTVVDGITIPTGHPRIWWTPARITQAKTWLVSNPYTPTSTDPWGNAFMYVMTGNTTYAQNVITQLMNFSISASELAGTASDNYRWADWFPVAYDWVHDQLTSSQKSALITKYDAYVVTLEGKSWGGVTMPASNYFWGYFRNELNWGIASYGDNNNATTHINFALNTRWPAFKTFASSGPCLGGVPTEGSQYGKYLLQYPTTPFVSANLLGRDIYKETNFFKEAIFWMIYSTTPDGAYIASFNDVETGTGAKDFYIEDAMRTAIFEFNSIPAGKYAQQWCNLVGTVTPGSSGAGGGAGTVDIWVQSVFNPTTTLPFSNLPLDYYAPGTEFFYLRDSWNTNATVVFLELGTDGNGGGHSQGDAGTFQIWNNGKWLAPENPGYSDTFADGTSSEDVKAHNGIYINNLGQSTAPNGNTVVSRLSTGSVFSYAACDLTQVYRSSNSNHDNPACTHLEREFLFIKPLKTLVILDRINVTTTSIVSQFFLHSPANPTISGSTATFTNGSEQMVLTALISGVTLSSSNEGTNGQLGQMYRLNEAIHGATQEYLINVIQVKDVGGPVVTPVIVDNGSSWKITLTSTLGNVVIVFNKGQTTNGGTADFNLTSVPTTSTPLRTTVQSISVGDNGPVWGA